MNKYDLWKQESDGLYKMVYETDCSLHNNTIHSVGYIDFTGSNSRTVKVSGEDNYQIIYILEGCGNYTINGVKFKASHGDIVIIPPNIPHKYNYNQSDNTKVYFMHFSGEKFSSILNMYNLKAHYSIGIQRKITDKFEEILETLKKKQVLYEEISISLAISLVASLVSSITLIKDIIPCRLSNAITHINQHPESSLSLNEYAKMCILSMSCFSREFKKITGFSPIAYRNKTRIDKAKKLLIANNLPLNVLSSSLGFSSYPQFFRQFKNFTGYTPQKYRQIHSIIT